MRHGSSRFVKAGLRRAGIQLRFGSWLGVSAHVVASRVWATQGRVQVSLVSRQGWVRRVLSWWGLRKSTQGRDRITFVSWLGLSGSVRAGLVGSTQGRDPVVFGIVAGLVALCRGWFLLVMPTQGREKFVGFLGWAGQVQSGCGSSRFGWSGLHRAGDACNY